MSFEKMKRDDLYSMAVDNFAVEVEETATKPQIIAALAEQGVTWKMAKTFDPTAAAVEEEATAPAGVITAASTNPPATKPVDVVPAVVETQVAPVVTKPEVVLVKMERENPRYEVRGYRFTQDSPFALVKAEDVDFILGHEWGFKIATPREAKEFYG